MASYGLLICLSVAVLTIVSAAPSEEKPFDCPANEIYYKCQYIRCGKTCDDLKNNPPCPSIMASCYAPACLCDVGYFRNSKGKCVPEYECNCPANEIYYKCQYIRCRKTCDDLKNNPPCPSIMASCYAPACLCDVGYFRNSKGKCVPEDECSKL